MPDPKMATTLVSLFQLRVSAQGDRPALHVRRGDAFRTLTWNEIAADARRMAGLLLDAGLRPGDRVVQVSENRYEWLVCDFAVHQCRGIHVAVHSVLSGPQIAWQINDCGAELVIVSGPEQADKLAALDLLPPTARFFSYDPCGRELAGRAITKIALDSASPESGSLRGALEIKAERVAPGDVATILYTSGTTGEPKGVMLTHANLAFNTLSSLEAFEISADDLRLCWLPLSHIFARTADLYTWIASGSELALSSRETVLADCQLLRPTAINGVPYFYDKLQRHLEQQGRAAEPGSLQRLLGGRMRLCCSGGAALPNAVAEFFAAQGVLLVQGYGLTETSPVISTGSAKCNRIGTVGPPIPGVEVRIAPDGEVLTRGPHVMLGYWNQPQATADVLHDGWLHTGDLGCLEDGCLEDGCLRITGRKKDLIVTAAGKNIAPAYLEGLLTSDPLIAQAVIVGEGRNYLTALIVPDRERLTAEIIRRGIPVTSAAEAVRHPQVLALYENCIADRLADVSDCEQVRRFTLLARGFTVETGELTPTLKLRRAAVLANLAAEVEAMYQAPLPRPHC